VVWAGVVVGGAGVGRGVTRLVMYECGDGIVRTRCRRHIPQGGPTAPRFVLSPRAAGGRAGLLAAWEGTWRECYVCACERWYGDGRARAEDQRPSDGHEEMGVDDGGFGAGD
jgi:hypothetical protein